MSNRIIKYNGGKTIRMKQKKHNSVFMVIFLCLCLFSFWGINWLILPTITLKGEKVVTLNYKEEYKESGYDVIYLGKNISDEVKVEGKVNSSKLGVYNILYSIKFGFLERKVVRKVIVADKSKPVIELASNEDIIICPGSKYKGEEFKAYDNYDGDISDKVNIILEKNEIIYSVVDDHGNKSSVSRKIIEKDNTKPEIKLSGSDIVYSYLGEEYKDKGYKALDNCDGDISEKVKVSGSVNADKVGKYKLIYTVTDKAGNKTEVSRIVNIVERGKNGVIYLTFDDGPKASVTNVILDILKEEDVKATFFVTNSGPDELIKRAYDEGHTIALHTATHDYSVVYASIDSYFNDLNSVSSRVKRITGYDSKIIRFPGGASNTVSRRYCPGIMSDLTVEVLKRGYKYYDWNISSGDASGGKITSSDIYNNVVSRLSHNKVNMVLMHDTKSYTRDALRDIIRYGKSNGYTFDKITMDVDMIVQRVNN